MGFKILIIEHSEAGVITLLYSPVRKASDVPGKLFLRKVDFLPGKRGVNVPVFGPVLEEDPLV